MYYRETWAEVDLDALIHNYQYLQKKAAHRAVFAVIKANAYGMGDAMVARQAIELGTPMLCVSSLDEALALRNKGIDHDVLVLGYTNPEDAEVIVANNVVVTGSSLEWLEKVVEYPCAGLRVHIKINSGMNRLGVNSPEQLQAMLTLGQDHGIRFEGIFTHFMSSGWDRVKTQAQFDFFKKLAQSVDFAFKWRHCANSDAILWFDEDYCNAVRPGIALYGCCDLAEEQHNFKDTMSLYSRVAQVKMLHKGDQVSYDGIYEAKNDEMVATIPMGYADGFVRKHQGHYSFIGNKPCAIVGKICMDQLMIRCDKETRQGDLVEFVGPHRSVKMIEEQTGITPCEFLTSVSDRIPRVYIKNNRVIGDINPRLSSKKSTD